MKKKSLLFIFLFIALFASAFSVKEWKDSIYEKIRKETLAGIKKTFKQDVSVGTVEGIVVGQVVFNDVVVPNFAYARKVYVNFNPVKFAYKKDVVPAISKITIVDAEFKVERNKADHWNILSLLPAPEPGAPPPPPFTAKLVFKNCKIKYRDQIGFRAKAKVFREEFYALGGEVSFRKKDKVTINLVGESNEAPLPTQVKLSGSINLKSAEYEINVSAKKVRLKKWGSYALPLDSLDLKAGEVDLDLKITPPKRKGWPVSLAGRFSLHNAKGRFADYTIDKTFGKLFIEDDKLSFEKIETQINNLPLEINGQFFDFAKQNLDLKISLKNAKLNKVISALPQTSNFALQGSGNASFEVRGTVSAPVITGNIKIDKANFYNQIFATNANLSFKEFQLKIDIKSLRLHGGNIKGNCKIDFSKEFPLFSLEANLFNLSLGSISQNAPGIVGRATGKINLSGPLSNLRGNLSANLSQAMFMGQPIEKLSSSFQIKEGNLYLNNFSATSKTAFIHSSGKVGRDLGFDFQAEAQGIKLAGKGPLGKMEAVLNHFQGDISWKLDSNFLASPLKNLTASGEASLSNGRIGEQLFDLAKGKLAIGRGLIDIKDVVLKKGTSVIHANGQTGVGFQTNLTIAGENIKLEDLRILNYLLPEQVKHPKGSTDIKIGFSGEIPEGTSLVSPDPLLNLNAKGQVNLHNVELASIPITDGSLNFQWQDRVLAFSNCRVEMPDSKHLSFDLILGKKSGIEGNFLGIIDLSKLKKFSRKYGKLEGVLGLNLILTGKAQNPDFKTSFWIHDFGFNKINMDRIQGDITLQQNILTFDFPLIISKSFDQYKISGTANLQPLQEGQLQESDVLLNLKIVDADLSSAINLFGGVQGEIARKLSAGGEAKKSKINLSSLALPTAQQFMHRGNISLYIKDGKRKCFLKSWEKLSEEIEKDVAAAPEEILGGALSGDILIKGKIKNLYGKFSGEVKKGFFRDYIYESLKANASLKNRKIKVEKLELSKENGKLSARGEIGFDGNLSLQVAAKDMPLDILRSIFNDDFKGNFNLRASLEGSFKNLNAQVEASAKNIDIANMHFDKASLSIAKDQDVVLIHDFSLIEGRNLSNIFGSLALTPPGKIELEAKLKNNAVGLLNLFSKTAKWRNGIGAATAKLSGTFEDLNINGKIKVKDATLYVKAIDAEIKGIQGEAKIKNSSLMISELTGIWQGQSSKNYLNSLGFTGSIDLRRILSENKMVGLALSFTPSDLYVNLPNLFAGEIKIKDARLSGPYYFDLSSGPMLSGEVEINNAVITLAKKKPRKDKVLPLNFDLLTKLKKNVYVVMGNVATPDLSNIFMNVEINSDELKIAGNFAYPSLLGKVLLKRGTVTIFNREFVLLTKESQETYFPYNAEKIKDNIALFTGEEGREGTLPDVTITAKVGVENLEEDTGGETTRTKVIILSHIKGVIGATEKERGLNITFDSFTEDETKSPSEFMPAGYSEQSIKVMLLPDFIKSLTGISQGEESQVNTKAVIADYLSSRFQTWAFRGIEREIEQRLGLESLTLEYNVGREVRQQMGIAETRTLEEEKPDWRVGFVKGFFDKFYIDVKYSQTAEETGLTETFKYQLTYKLNPIWSIIYYREPASLQEFTTGLQKTTLKAGFSFW